MKTRALKGAVCAVIGASLLAGCISILPKEKAAQLYRFGSPSLDARTPPAGQTRFPVQMIPLTFNRAAAGDRILTMTGNEAAYIKGSRWVAAANTLFETAVANAFDNDGGAARLMARGEPGHPDYTLKLDVRAFETRYEHGQGAAPTVVIELYAALGQVEGRVPTGERIFRASVPAADNRVGAITAAYDQAVTKVLGDMVAWVDAKGASA
jgi:cholesterol transport system auxiliary component